MRYRLVDEPRPGPLQRIALPPFLVFLAAQFFMPWGALLVGVNAVALNGPHRNREIGLSVLPVIAWFGGLFLLNLAVQARALTKDQADYLFVVVIGLGLLALAIAYVSQAHTADLRQYLRQQG